MVDANQAMESPQVADGENPLRKERQTIAEVAITLEWGVKLGAGTRLSMSCGFESRRSNREVRIPLGVAADPKI